MYSTSFININGDKKQSKIKIIFYVFVNFIQNLYLNLHVKKFSYIKFNNKFKKVNFNNNHSISRKLCSLFWKNINWKIINNYLGNLNIHELGAGDGTYFKDDIDIKNKFYKKYSGYDVNSHDNWKKYKRKKINYKKFDGINFLKTFDKHTNIFISQSCLEHVKYDLKYFEEIKKFSRKNKKKIMFIHCVPSPFCLFTYLTHGYRQYNIKNFNKISSIFSKENLFVCKLGNLSLNLHHLIKTTLPLIFYKKNLMSTQSKKYYNSINKNIISPKNTSIFFCSFIVMVGFVNFKEDEKKKIIKFIFK